MLPLKHVEDVPEIFLVPSMSILGPVTVIVIGDRYTPLVREGSRIPPVEVARQLLETYGRLHLLDLKGVQRDSPQWDVIRSLAELGPLWVDVGAASADSVIDIIMAGAEAAVLPLRFLESLDEVASALELTDNVIVQVDMEERILGPERVSRCRGLIELLEELAVLGVRRVILHDHLNPPTPLKKGSIGDYLEMYWASKSLEEIYMAFNAGFDGAVVSLGELMGGEVLGGAKENY